MSGWIALAGIAIGSILLAIALTLYGRQGYNNLLLALIWGAAGYFVFGIGLSGGYWYYVLKPAKVEVTRPPAFAITYAGGFDKNERDFDALVWIKYNSQLGCTISPIHKAVMIRLTNLQPIDSVIETYVMEVQNPNGDWVKLIRMDGSKGRVYSLTKDELKRAKGFDLKTLDSLIAGKRIAPNETVEGVVLFELPQSIAPKAPMRFYVKDFGGASMTQRVYPGEKNWDFGQNWQMKAVEETDLSKCAVRFYSEAPYL